MGNFQQRIDIFEVDLPEPENLSLPGMQGREINVGPRRTKEKVIVVFTLVHVIPCFLDHSSTHTIAFV